MQDFKSNAALARGFYAAWRRLAKDGRCDALDSVECVRVYCEWVCAERPLKVLSFIIEAANRPPSAVWPVASS